MNENERPKRSKARKNYKEEQSDDDHEAPVDNYEPEPTSEIEKDTFKLEVRPSKRKKNASPSKKEGPTKVRRRKAGSLERMLTLPPEMQDEILGHVAPETLVMCLQVRPFRQRLRMTSAESIWKRSRINAGMPALRATDMTERRYLTLLFDKHCHDCGDPKVNHNELDLLACVRLCTECRNNWKTYDNRKRLRMIKKLHVNAEECAKDFQSGGAPMPRGIDKISKYLNHLSRLQPEQIAPYVAKRKALKDQIEEDAATIQKWNRQVSEERFTNYGEILEARKAQIYQKLLEEGWTETTIPNGWEREAQVTYATKLTKAGWTKIKGPLQTALRWKIEWHRESERSARVRQAYQLILQDKPLFPSWTTFSRFPTIKALLDIPKADRPEHESFVAFDQAKWNAALPDTEPRVAAYEDRMRELAVQRLGEAYNAQGLPIPEDIISAPQSYFEYFQGEPPGDWNPISTQVDKFPKIHAIMRDRQPVGFHSVAPGEFETAKPPSYPGTREEWLKVHLKDLDSMGN